ncbi:hypothetical protein [Methylobacterium nodulans]|uniref:Uncharacterized protein n=1 Tax=Methylobacterium nodulans (strain LMG 21967 / CNCM I-2342 / ORS 2060) TaxID=460265 RepID=B8IAK7_METNO|nr:hypothetical protein [Methylobacterium nodulans]ACL61052.1 hypothetical protein Mnod_6246 [Methylobacterium nodulans ORS 2060]
MTLDGERLDRVITADDLADEVVIPAEDADGYLRPDPRRPGHFLDETRRGRVRITRKHPHWRGA